MISAKILSLSDALGRAERMVSIFLVVLLVGLILLNVATRAVNIALFWVDELAVYAMIWMALIGGSLLLHERRHVSVTLVSAVLSERRASALLTVVDLLVLAFSAGLFVMCLVWYDLPGLMQHDFDIEEFAATTFNFIYQEPTTTLGIRKFWVWLVVPVVALSMTVHALGNLLRKAAPRDTA